MPTMTTGASSEPDQPRAADQPKATGFPYALMLTDAASPDDPVVYVNAAFTRLTGYEADEALGRSCHFLPGAGRAGAVAAALRDGGALEASLVTIRADGERSVGHARVVPVEPTGGKADGHADGHLDGHAGGMDRTGDALTLLELRHRVRNHLSLVLGMLRLQAAEDEAARDVLTETAGRIEALAFLYAQELDEQGGPDGADPASEVELGAYLGRVGTALGGLSPDVSVRVAVADGVRMPGHDAARLGLVVTELVTNTVRHAYAPGERGEVRIALERSGDRLRLTVADDGAGMPQTRALALALAQGTGAESGTGNGLGSMIVRNLVRSLGGHLDYAPTVPGAGACAVVDLPGPFGASSPAAGG